MSTPATLTPAKEPPRAPTSNELAVDRTRLAAGRTLMAADRSLMAWVRTGLSMISFGFTIYKLLQGFLEQGGNLPDIHSPRVVGLFLTGLGTVSILMGTVEYWHRRSELMKYAPVPLWRPSFAMAAIMSLAGLVLFFGIISRQF